MPSTHEYCRRWRIVQRSLFCWITSWVVTRRWVFFPVVLEWMFLFAFVCENLVLFFMFIYVGNWGCSCGGWGVMGLWVGVVVWFLRVVDCGWSYERVAILVIFLECNVSFWMFLLRTCDRSRWLVRFLG